MIFSVHRKMENKKLKKKLKRGNHGFYDQPVLIIITAAFIYMYWLCMYILHAFMCVIREMVCSFIWSVAYSQTVHM